MKILYNTKRYNRGFTLIELMVSVSLYTVIAVSLVSILLMVSTVNKRLQSNEHAINNLIVSVESLKREMKLGTNFRCDADGSALALSTGQFVVDNATPRSASVITNDCRLDTGSPDANKGGNTRITFRADINTFASYHMGTDGSGGIGIIRSTYDTNGDFVSNTRLTSNDIEIQSLRFYAEGTDQSDARQPIIIVKATGINKKLDGKNGPINKVFFIETAVTPIGLDG